MTGDSVDSVWNYIRFFIYINAIFNEKSKQIIVKGENVKFNQKNQ